MAGATTLTRMVAAAGLAVALVAFGGTPVGADTRPQAPAPVATVAGQPIRWVPYRTGPISYDNGECPFPVTGSAVVDREQEATLATFPDGSPQLELYRGALIVRFTNTTNGHSRTVDISGRGAVQYDSNGSQIFFMDGPVAVGVRPTDHYPRGLYRFTGTHILYTAPDRTDRRVLLDRGREQNLCPLLR